jgi:ElaB/YqjD/DUF883 family membrane-anchored ribosome-binding protein
LPHRAEIKPAATRRTFVEEGAMHRTANTTTATGAASSGIASFEESGRALAQSKDELMREFRTLIRDGESLLRSTTSVSGDALAQAREQFRVKLEEARKRISDVSRVATLRGRQAAAATDDYVHANPWPVIGAAAGIGVLLGILLSRR